MANGNFVENLVGDLKHAVRVLWRSPAFAATAIAALALGIGANTAIFSVVNAVLLQPLSYPQPDRLVALMRHFPDGDGNSARFRNSWCGASRRKCFRPSRHTTSQGPGINLTGGDRPAASEGHSCFGGLLRCVRRAVAIGRTFTPTKIVPAARTSSSSATDCGAASSAPIPPSSAKRSRSPATLT